VVPQTAEAGGEEFDYRATAIIGAELVGVEIWFGRHDGASWVGAHGGVRYAAGRRLARKKSLPVNYAGGGRNDADLCSFDGQETIDSASPWHRRRCQPVLFSVM
jgi:hypothetical protein